MCVSCGEDFLKEQPRTLFVPSYFNTEAGVEGGLNYMYYHLRNVYGGGNMINQMGPGTDEFTCGGSARIEHQVADMGEGTTQWSASQNPASSTWTTCFGNINTANGVIENGEKNGVSPALLAEAYFFRAFDYFLLVQT
ncbi:MAG: RagB/SusD family nutrient uptake outer membrane protein, partial [Bacteroidales bacterium]|nr:RagB/SusD family nutrient uptake outer membrane protein [Bacteroidales bacterium]